MEVNRKLGTFPHSDDKYKYCCRSIHISNLARLVLILNLVVHLFFLFALLVTYPSYDELAFHALNIICLVLVYIGMRKNSSKYLIPRLVLSVIVISLYLAALILNQIIIQSPYYSLYGALKMREEVVNKDHIKILVVDLVTSVLYWMYYVVSFYVFCKLYVYLRDLERYYATLKSDKEAGPE